MQNTRIRLLAGGLLLLITGGYVQAETLQPDPAWQQGKLANGFQWQILVTPQRPSDRVEMRLLINTGSLAESAQQSGFNHFLSRMILNQSGHQAKLLWQQQGGPQYLPPAIVSYDNTLFNVSLANNRSASLKAALSTLAHSTGLLQVTPEAIEATEQRSNPVKTWPDTQDSWWRYRLKGSALLVHDPASNVAFPLDAEKLKSFYQKWYTPDAMTLVVVGNVDSRYLVEQLNKTFGELKGKRETPAPVPVLATLSTAPVSLMSNDIRQNNKLSLTWDTPWQPIRESGALLNYWRADLAREALFWNVQQHLKKKNIKDINLSFDCRVLYQLAQCAINIESSNDTLAANLAQVGRELLEVKNNGLSQDEFHALIAQKKNELAQLFATYTRMDTGMLMGQRIRTQQNQVVDISPESYQTLRQGFLDNLTVSALNQDVRQQLSQNMSLILLQPQGEPEYNMQALQAVWDSVMKPPAAAPVIDDPRQNISEKEAVLP